MLRPGLYAHTTIVVDEHPGALTLPATALVRLDGRAHCVAIEGGVARRKAVTIGLEDGTLAEILSGLKGDELIVKAAAAALVEGQPLAVIEPPPSSGKP
jgi:hypothetical protein